MYATALKEYGKKIAAKSDISARQNVLLDLMKIKFGDFASDGKKILSQTNAAKIDKALHKILTAKTREEVLKYLD